MIDPFEDIGAPDEGSLGELAKQVSRHDKLSQELAQLEAELKAKQAEIRRLEEEVIPDIMTQAGTTEFRTNDGLSVEILQKIYGSLPKDDTKRSAALAEVIKAGGQSIIKNTLSAQFEKGQSARAVAAQKALADLDVAALLKEDIHHSTYAAWINERVKNGEAVDLDALGAYTRRFAKIKRS